MDEPSSPDDVDLRTQLSADRTVLAAERTYAAWVRTGLAALASGVGAGALLDPLLPRQLTVTAGTVLSLFSAFCFAAAVWRELGERNVGAGHLARHLPLPLLVAINGVLVLVGLSTAVAIVARG